MAKEPKCTICGGAHYQTFCHQKQNKPIKKKSLIEQAGEHLRSIEKSQNIIRSHISKAKEFKPSEVINKKLYIKVTKERKPLGELLRLAEIVFNKWIRNRDRNELFPDYFFCIACSKQKPIEESDCGHFKPKSFSSLRFNEFNTNAECQKCNREDPNHLIGYRENLIKKIGLEQVEALEAVKFSEEHRWDREELLDIIKRYKI